MEYRRTRLHGGTFFFTLVTLQRTPYFHDESNIALLGDAIRFVQRQHPFELIAYVVFAGPSAYDLTITRRGRRLPHPGAFDEKLCLTEIGGSPDGY